MESLDGEAVLYNPKLGSVHRFDSATLVVWLGCDGCRTLEGVAAMLCVQDEMSAREARTFVEQVVVELVARDLVVVKEGAKPTTGQSPTGKTAWRLDDRATPRSLTRQASDSVLSRRELLSGGASRLALASPVISTFFATGAYASGASASGAFGTDANGGCKTILYSCAVNADCCEDPVKTTCENNDPGPGKHCCAQANEACTSDEECCGNKTCQSSTCQN